jgi:hypothetical protein
MTAFAQQDAAPEKTRANVVSARGVVWLGGLLLIALDLTYVAIFGRNVPVMDDYMVIPPLAGAVNFIGWLWEQFNYHRFPLPKLIYFYAIKWSGWDFRTPMFLSVGLLGAIGLLLAETARRVRGGTARYTDLFFPILFLHGGHAGNMLIAVQLNLVFPIFLICLCLAISLQVSNPARSATVWRLGACLLLLAFSGGFGLTFILAFACWLIYIGIAPGSAADSPRWLSVVMGVGLLGLLAFYFLMLQRPADAPPTQRIGASLLTALQALSTCFGSAAKKIWIATGPLIGIAALLILLTITAIVIRAWLRIPSERFRAAALLAGLAGLVGLMLGIGWSRAGFGPLYGLQARYVTAATPLLACAYFAVELYPPGAPGRAARGALFALAVAIFLIHIQPALNFGRGEATMVEAYLSDLRRGVPREEILDRYTVELSVSRHDLDQGIRLLHQSGVAPY